MSDYVETYLAALTALRLQLENHLSTDEAQSLAVKLDELRALHSDDDEFVNEVLDFLQEDYPTVYEHLQAQFEATISETVAVEPIRIQPLAGPPTNLTPGMLLYCPKCDYEYELRHVGEWPVFCPNDGSQLKSQADDSNVS